MMPLPPSLREFRNLSAQQWLDRASRTVPQAASVALVIAIAWQLVQLTWLLLDRAPDAASIPVVASSPSVTPARKGIDVQTIVNAHLFGVPAAQTRGPEEAPETQMNLVLSGVLPSEDPSKGLAIIGESAQASKVYTVGESIRQATQTRLHAVYVDRVILDRNGQLEALALPKQSTSSVAINRPAPPAPNNQFASNLRSLVETNPSAIAQIVRPQPVFANGVQRGYRVYPGRNRQEFAKLGLQPGDLILAINGTPLDDPQRGIEVFNTLGSSGLVNVTIERSGQTQELTLNTAQITLPDADAPDTADTPIRTGARRRTPAPGSTPSPQAQ